MIKLPEPISEIVEETDEREGFAYKTAHFSWDSASTRTKLFTESQLKQHGDDRAREALESAAAISRKYNHPIAGVIEHEIIALSKDEL
jgi:hypothetical protein